MPEFETVKDSGQREEFSTGSKRDSREGKGRYDLLSPLALARLARHFENGAKKYGDRNWERGQPQARYLDSALRHLFNYLEGKRDEDHLSAAAWNVLAMIHQEEAIDRRLMSTSLLDGMPSYLPDPRRAEFLERARSVAEVAPCRHEDSGWTSVGNNVICCRCGEVVPK